MPKRRRLPPQAMPEPAPAHINWLIEHAPDAADQVAAVPVVLGAPAAVVEVGRPDPDARAQPDLAGLTAGDAEMFEQMAAAKRASTIDGADLLWAARVNCSATAQMAGPRHERMAGRTGRKAGVSPAVDPSDRRRGFHPPRLLAAACAGTLGSSIAKMRTECPDDASPANR